MIRLFPKDNSEAALVHRAQKGDAEAVKAVYDANVQYLAAVCRRYVPSDDDARDVLQEAFVKIFTSLENFEFRGSGSLRGWMSRIVVNTALGFLRKEGMNRLLNPDDPLPDIPDEGDPDPDGIPHEVLLDMISGLPPVARTIFNLYVFEQKSHKEIAEILGIKENSSTSQFHKARKILAKRINDYRHEHGLER